MKFFDRSPLLTVIAPSEEEAKEAAIETLKYWNDKEQSNSVKLIRNGRIKKRKTHKFY